VGIQHLYDPSMTERKIKLILYRRKETVIGSSKVAVAANTDDAVCCSVLQCVTAAVVAVVLKDVFITAG